MNVLEMALFRLWGPSVDEFRGLVKENISRKGRLLQRHMNGRAISCVGYTATDIILERLIGDSKLFYN